MLIGASLGILDIIFMLALIGFALWKTSWVRVILSLCVIIWGTFAMAYDIKVALPLLAIGTVLFFMGILRIIQQRRSEAAETEG